MRIARTSSIAFAFGALALASVGALGAILTGCDDDRRAPAPPAPAPPASVVRALGADAGKPEARKGPFAPAGDLKAEMDAFASVDGCVEQHASVDALIGDALESFGYDTLVRDACQLLEAAKTRHVEYCARIDSSAVRGHCEATVAEMDGDADACPWVAPARRALGRDPVCVAISLRRADLCAAATGPTARATCEAMTLHEGAPCQKLALPADQIRCERDAQRWRSVTPPPDPHAAVVAAPSGKLHVDAGARGAAIDADLGADLAGGAVLVKSRDGGGRIVLGRLDEADIGFVATTPQHRATLALEILASPPPGPAHVERAQLLLPGHLPLAAPGATSTLVAKLSKLEPTRGGMVEFTVDGTLAKAEDTWTVHAEGRTFVRDVVAASVLVDDLALPAFGIDGGLR